jgi:CelD/BcsL family acetyltransferase involved in cellulose biosynthesis
MIEVREINEIDALGEFRHAWHSMLQRTQAASFFQSLEWLECYWKHFATRQRLRVLVVADNGQPVGILPLVVRTEATRVGRLRMLTYPLHDWATFYGPIGSNPSATLVAGLRHVRQSPWDWDVLDLRWTDVDGADQGRTERAMAQAGFRPSRQKWDRTSLLELPDSWQTYWRGRDSKFRKNVDRLQRRMAEKAHVEMVRYRPQPTYGFDVDPRWDLYDACVEIARRSWQGVEGDNTNLCHAEVSGFLHDAHLAAARLGALDLNLLLLNGEPAAFMYNYCWQGAVYGLRRGYDPKFKHFRPGLIQQKMMLEDGLLCGDRSYDLGGGNHGIKEPWRTKVAASYRLTFFSPLVFRAQLLRWNRWLRRQLHGEHDIACSQVV